MVEKLLAPAAAARAAARDHARPCAATSPATTATCATSACDQHPRPGLPRQAVGARRSPRSTPTGASTSSRCSPASGVAIDGIGGAQPPTPARRGAGAAADAARDCSTQLGEQLPLGGIGSQRRRARQATRPTTATGMLLGNPHFPWDGSERFYQAHLTIPGKIDVAGGALFGVPLVLIGHTRDAGLEPHGLDRVPLHAVRAEARARLADDVPRRRPAEADDARDGHRRRSSRPTARSSRTRTLYSTATARCSPRSSACRCSRGRRRPRFAMGDANAANFRYLNHFFETNQAQSRRASSTRSCARNQGIPWVNTIAADSHGRGALRRHRRRSRNVTDAQGAGVQHARSAPATFAAAAACRCSTARARACDWGNDPDAVAAGHLRPAATCRRCSATTTSRTPTTRYWLSNPRAAARGLRADHRRRAHGARRCARGSGLMMVAGAAGDGGKFTPPGRCRTLVFNNRQYAGELCARRARRDVPRDPTLTRLERPGRRRRACAVLEAGTCATTSTRRGALLFRRFATRALALGRRRRRRRPSRDAVRRGRPGQHAARPEHRQPAGARRRSATRSTTCSGAGIPLDAPLRRLPVRDARRRDRSRSTAARARSASSTRSTSPCDRRQGLRRTSPHGSTFVQAVAASTATAARTRARSSPTRSRPNPTSPYYADQTRLFSRKRVGRHALLRRRTIRPTRT